MPPAAPISPAISARIIHAVSGANFGILIPPFTGLLLFVNHRPSRLAEG